MYIITKWKMVGHENDKGDGLKVEYAIPREFVFIPKKIGGERDF